RCEDRQRPVHRGTVSRLPRQRAQGRHSDSRILRPPRRDHPARRSTASQQASAGLVPPSGGRVAGRDEIEFGKRGVPGGAAGLQIREGPRAGSWWVRLPLSSATFKECTMIPTTASFLGSLQAAAAKAETAEVAFRRGIAERVNNFEHERAVAYRRLNFMRALADATTAAESEEIAVAGALAVVRAKLGWSSDSESRTA